MDLASIGITKEEVLDRIAESVLAANDGLIADASRDIRKAMLSEVNGKINKLLESALESILDSAYTPMDSWGEPKGETTTLRNAVKDKALLYLTEKVDESGRAGNYQSSIPRGQWLAQKAAKEAVDLAMRHELDKAVGEAKAQIRKQVAGFIADTILKLK